VVFFNWVVKDRDFLYYEPNITKNAFQGTDRADSPLTQSVFIPKTTQAVTANQCGDILVWDISMIIDGVAQPNERRLIKVVTFHTFSDSLISQQKMSKSKEGKKLGYSIQTLNIHKDYLVCGFEDGSVKFYDFFFKVKAWFESLGIKSVKSVSFSNLQPERISEVNIGSKDHSKNEPIFSCAQFIIADDNATIIKCKASQFDAIHEQDKKGELILETIQKPI